MEARMANRSPVPSFALALFIAFGSAVGVGCIGFETLDRSAPNGAGGNGNTIPVLSGVAGDTGAAGYTGAAGTRGLAGAGGRGGIGGGSGGRAGAGGATGGSGGGTAGAGGATGGA